MITHLPISWSSSHNYDTTSIISPTSPPIFKHRSERDTSYFLLGDFSNDHVHTKPPKAFLISIYLHHLRVSMFCLDHEPDRLRFNSVWEFKIPSELDAESWIWTISTGNAACFGICIIPCFEELKINEKFQFPMKLEDLIVSIDLYSLKWKVIAVIHYYSWVETKFLAYTINSMDIHVWVKPHCTENRLQRRCTRVSVITPLWAGGFWRYRSRLQCFPLVLRFDLQAYFCKLSSLWPMK